MEYSNKTTENEICDGIQFYINGVTSVIICIVGIIGNSMSMHALKVLQDRSPAGTLLRVMAVSDVIFVSTHLFTRSVPALLWVWSPIRQVWPYMYALLDPVSRTALAVTTWITVLLAKHRYDAVSKCESIISYKTARKIKLHIFILVSFAIMLHIPRIWEYELLPGSINESQKTLKPPYSSLYRNWMYQLIYKLVIYNNLMVTIPLISLYVLTVRLKDSLLELKRRFRNSVNLNQKRRTEAEKMITVVCMTIVVVFFVCHTPALIYRFLRFAMFSKTGKQEECVPPYSGLYAASQILFLVNSSANFFIYLALCKRFRAVFMSHWICGIAGNIKATVNRKKTKSLTHVKTLTTGIPGR